MITQAHKIPVSESFLRIQQMLADITGNDVSDIYPDSIIHEDLNMTPMELAQFLAQIEGVFAIKLRREDLEDFETIQDLVDEIDERVS
jgi:acyl carrier protein